MTTPDDDVAADRYSIVDEVLTAAGLSWYEVSNWARPGHECRHNLLYWRAGDYLGFGCAAHSHVAGRRWWNLRTPERYIDAVEAGLTTEAAGETLDPEARTLLQVRINHADEADEIFSTLMGDVVEPRRDFIQDNALKVANLDV